MTEFLASSTLHTIIYLVMRTMVKFNKILQCFVVIHYTLINDFGVVISITSRDPKSQ